MDSSQDGLGVHDLTNTEDYSNADPNMVFMADHGGGVGDFVEEDYEEEYIQLADGRLVPSSQVQMEGMDAHSQISEQDHQHAHSQYMGGAPIVSQAHSSHSSGGPAVFAIRGSQMFRVEKSGAAASEPMFKYVDNTLVKEEPSFSQREGGTKSMYHVQQPSSSTSVARPFVPFNEAYATHEGRPKMEYNPYESVSSAINVKQPKPRKKHAAGQRKPCNCTKSMCLKLYCDCFANGEFCRDCNCKDCHNNVEYEVDRTRAIKQCLERNPNAFKPKIGVTKAGQADLERLHQKGCHCKKSGCLKNYCECFEAKVPCTDRCKCKGCQNTEHDRASRYKDKLTNSALMNLANAATASSTGSVSSRGGSPISDDEDSDTTDGDPRTFPWFYMTDEVIEAATLCMVAQSEELLSRVPSQDVTEGVVENMENLILKEFGRCMEQIITSASNST